jgi:hypothetical protein
MVNIERKKVINHELIKLTYQNKLLARKNKL